MCSRLARHTGCVLQATQGGDLRYANVHVDVGPDCGADVRALGCADDGTNEYAVLCPVSLAITCADCRADGAADTTAKAGRHL